MKLIRKAVPLTLSGSRYTCDILLDLYQSNRRPAIFLCASRPNDLSPEKIWSGTPIAIASVNPPEEYIQHLSATHFAAKNYSENAGLWEQLSQLRDKDRNPLFTPTRWVITLGFANRVHIMDLGPQLRPLYEKLVEDLPKETLPHG